MRLDSGHDAMDNRFQIKEAGVDFIIKWNPRRQDLSEWVKEADVQAQWETHREGKRVAVYSETIEESLKDKTEAFRRVIRVIERTIDKHGQRLLIPDITLEGWWTTLDEDSIDNESIIQLYREHATSEQFHSEFKTDLDIERLPSASLIPMTSSLPYRAWLTTCCAG